MKAIIRNIDKARLPHRDGQRVHIVTDVDFVNDAGDLVLYQRYAHLPEDFDGAYFQRQADAMQSDLDCLRDRERRVSAIQEEERPADEAIRKFKLEFGEAAQLRDEVKHAG